MTTITKDKVEIKYFDTDIQFIKSTDEYATTRKENVEERTITAVISASNVDRVGDRIMPGAFVNFKDGAGFPLLLFHDQHALPIGVSIHGKKRSDDYLMTFKLSKIAIANDIYELAKEGFIKKVSVGFRVLKDGAQPNNFGGYDITKAELLEISAVNVPANDKAGIVAVKELYASGKLEISKEMYDTICGIELIPSVKELEADQTVIWLEKGDPSLQKPFPNEHSCRLNDPGKYEKFARKNCEFKSDDKCIDVIYGIAEGKSEIQAYRYPKGTWEVDSARSHCKSHDGSFEAASSEEASFEERIEKAECQKELYDITLDFNKRVFDRLVKMFEILETNFSLQQAITKSGVGDAVDQGIDTKLDAGDADDNFIIEIED